MPGDVRRSAFATCCRRTVDELALRGTGLRPVRSQKQTSEARRIFFEASDPVSASVGQRKFLPAEREHLTRQTIASPWLGQIEAEADCEMFFPFGIPGFEEMRRVIPVEIPAQRPLVYLVSADRPELCFIALPVLVIDPHFKLTVGEDECAAIGVPPEPRIGEDVLCLALLIPSAGSVKANLGAPLVINLRNLRGIQCAPPDGYSGCFSLSADGKWEPAC